MQDFTFVERHAKVRQCVCEGLIISHRIMMP